MKGMQSIKRDRIFDSFVKYGLRKEPHHKVPPFIIGGNVKSLDIEKIIYEFTKSGEQRKDVEKPAWHNSLRLPVGEYLTNEDWVIITNYYMKRMGFTDFNKHCYIMHDDEKGQHIHIIANRINFKDGSLYLGKNENYLSGKIIYEIEEKFDLTKTKAAFNTDNFYFSEKELYENNKKEIKKIIIDSLKLHTDIVEFINYLSKRNVRVIPNIATTGLMSGFSFEYRNEKFKASEIEKSLSWKNLKEKIYYSPSEHNHVLFKLKNG